MTPTWAQLRDLLIRRRRSLGVTQAQLATMLGANQSMVSNYETGRVTSPGIDIIWRWCDALDIGVNLTLTPRNVPDASVQYRVIRPPAPGGRRRASARRERA